MQHAKPLHVGWPHLSIGPGDMEPCKDNSGSSQLSQLEWKLVGVGLFPRP